MAKTPTASPRTKATKPPAAAAKKPAAAAPPAPSEVETAAAEGPPVGGRYDCHMRALDHLRGFAACLGMVQPKQQNGNMARLASTFQDGEAGIVEALQRMKQRGE